MKISSTATIAVLLIIGALLIGWYYVSPGKYDAFAACVEESGAKFYGAFWCPNCQDQKSLFGKSAKLLPYIECSTPDGKNQFEICRDAGIEGYPTWDFVNGDTGETERSVGVISLAEISELSGCPL